MIKSRRFAEISLGNVKAITNRKKVTRNCSRTAPHSNKVRKHKSQPHDHTNPLRSLKKFVFEKVRSFKKHNQSTHQTCTRI